jgi:superfamily II DNA/RNA helicase
LNLQDMQDMVRLATAPAFRERLLARGQARSMVWQDGVLLPGAPQFSPNLSYDLLSYAYSLISMAIRLRETGGDVTLIRGAFEQAASALEAVIAKGETTDPQRDFHRLLAACAFHLGRFSARAFSLLHVSLKEANFSSIERALALLILRSFQELQLVVSSWCIGNKASDDTLRAMLAPSSNAMEIHDDTDGTDNVLDVADLALTQNFMRSLGAFLLALETGDARQVETTRAGFSVGLRMCGDLNLVPQWWCYRLAMHMLDDLWSCSFHTVLPTEPPQGDAAAWHVHRSLFIALLMRRSKAEIELWPSQLEAATRAVDINDDLVVSLPTSAGKTRIAELCILRSLSEGKRVVFITPLRALSAQTEAGLHRTFTPLGKSISALYGSIGSSNFEEDAIRERDIVVATPEKLDFALRNDPTLLDDVGLIVLDEGHMIGLGEREVRYEVQIQRLLRRADANRRRIVCLSAILPSGDQFDDFVQWLRDDEQGAGIANDWRPTRVRFGEVLWGSDRARLELRVGDERPFVPTFLSAKQPTSGGRTAPFPRDQRELCLATAWRLVEDGQSVLIYCPERRSVEPFAKSIVDLNARGLIDSVIGDDSEMLTTALSIGREWLGYDHPVLSCLKLGVAVHHGALPTPFRKEIERLLRDGVLKVTISSPTLAQGLNLSATAIVFHSLMRSGQIIPASEFKNVIGRAGRAFVDVEGLVLFPVFTNHATYLARWRSLTNDSGTNSMESGLMRLVLTLLQRMHRSLGEPPFDTFLEYIVNNTTPWQFPEVANEDKKDRDRALADWEKYLATLDTAILSIAGEQDVGVGDLAATLDDVLKSSLWERRLRHRKDNLQTLLRQALLGRAQQIWGQTSATQRKGYFLAGVGLTTGQRLDAIATEANDLLVRANSAILFGENENAIDSIIELAELLFKIPPFVPEPMPANWREILRLWLKGGLITELDDESDEETLRFIENGLVYRLPWGMEAIRVRAQANADQIDGIDIGGFELRVAVPAVETGTLVREAAMLMQAGFYSRIAAIRAIEDTNADFDSMRGLAAWLHSEAVVELTGRTDWPTLESAQLWKAFVFDYQPPDTTVWTARTASKAVVWKEGVTIPASREYVKVITQAGEKSLVVSPTYEVLGHLDTPIDKDPLGLLISQIDDSQDVQITYYGPGDVSLQ